MSDDKAPEGAAGTDPVALTLLLFSETAEAVRALSDQVRAGDFGKLDELAREQANLRKALLLAMQERQQADRIRREQHGGDDHGLDLDAARAEIGRRLARLRDAAGEGPRVPKARRKRGDGDAVAVRDLGAAPSDRAGG